MALGTPKNFGVLPFLWAFEAASIRKSLLREQVRGQTGPQVRKDNT